MGRITLIFITLIIMATFSIIALWFGFNGQSIIEILNRLPQLFSPSNYVYLMWLVIFVSLLIWLIKYRFELFHSTKQRVLVFWIAALQMTFFYFWQDELFIVAFVIAFIETLLIFALYNTFALKAKPIHLRIPVALFLSWQIFMLLVDFSYIFVYFEWNGFGLSNALWVVIMMTVGTAAALHLRYHHADIISPIVFIWGYIGIAVNNGLDELLVSTAALFLCGVMIVGILFIKKITERKCPVIFILPKY